MRGTEDFVNNCGIGFTRKACFVIIQRQQIAPKDQSVLQLLFNKTRAHYFAMTFKTFQRTTKRIRNCIWPNFKAEIAKRNFSKDNLLQTQKRKRNVKKQKVTKSENQCHMYSQSFPCIVLDTTSSKLERIILCKSFKRAQFSKKIMKAS